MNRLVLVTGCGRGLGYQVARKHLELGDRVYGLARQNSEPLKELADCYPSLSVHLCDLGNTAEVEQAMKALADSGETLDLLYNVAGLFFESDRVPLEEADLDRYLQLYNINALGCLRVMKYALPALKPGSLLLNVSSEAGSIADCRRSQEYGYCMSKAALNIASKILSNQLAGKGVRILCYHPGWMKTAMGGEGARHSPTALTPEEAARRILEVALHPEDIPEDVMFLDYRKQKLNW